MRKAKFQVITPKMARQMLEHNTSNRPMKLNNVNEITGAIQRKEWRVNGETIIFNCDGTLLDGQNRLQACVNADMPFETLVVTGIDRNVFPTIDGGAKRTAGDSFAVEGETNYNALAAAIMWAMRIEAKGIQMWRKFTTTQAFVYLGANPGIRDSVTTIVHSHIKEVCSFSLAAAVHYLAGTRLCGGDATQVDEFFRKVATGEMLPKSDPAYLFRERMIKDKGQQSKLTRGAVAALLVKSCSASLTGKTIKTLRWTPNEDFPYAELGIE